MIQVQNGRFFYNWMAQGQDSHYPRYTVICPEFVNALSDFRRFLTEELIGEFRPNQWELTYINQVAKGDLWTTPADWARVFRRPEMLPLRLGIVPMETVSFAWRGVIQPNRGRLHVEIQRGQLAVPEGQETLTITLTARGPANSDAELSDGLGHGHNAIIGGFRDLTSDQALARWGLTDDGK